jgi:hypothetical protein
MSSAVADTRFINTRFELIVLQRLRGKEMACGSWSNERSESLRFQTSGNNSSER